MYKKVRFPWRSAFSMEVWRERGAVKNESVKSKTAILILFMEC